MVLQGFFSKGSGSVQNHDFYIEPFARLNVSLNGEMVLQLYIAPKEVLLL